MKQARRVWTVASPPRAAAASLWPDSYGFGGWRGWVEVVLGALLLRSVDDELLAGPIEKG
jgi:hypothetical protein